MKQWLCVVLCFSLAGCPDDVPEDDAPDTQTVADTSDSGGDTGADVDGPDLGEPDADPTDTLDGDTVDGDTVEPDATDDTLADTDMDGDLGEPDSGPDAVEPVDTDTTAPDIDDVSAPISTLCDPCATDETCDGLCAVLGDEGSFCTVECGDGCPDGYSCESVISGGEAKNACVPDSGVCECSESAIEAGLSTACFNVNDFGSCEGVRTCAAEGLTECSAPDASAEVCGGGDENCDGVIDEAGAAGCTVLFADEDTDDYGNPDNSQCLCEPTGVYTVLVAGDCDDADPDVGPEGIEVCNGKDDDCDGVTDPETASECVPWYLDGDGDGWGVQEVSICACGPTGDYGADKPGDCDDGNGGINPDQPCGPALCSFFVLSGGCPPGPCDATNPPAPCPGGFTCLDDSQCRSACTSSTHCQPGLHCDDGACVPVLPDGSECTSALQCASGYCGQGYCCAGGACCGGSDETCDDGNACTAAVCGDDFVCSVTELTGTCAEAGCNGMTFTTAGVCENGVCNAVTENCAGHGACTTYGCDATLGCTAEPLDDGTPCGGLTCVGFELTEPKWCDGAGACTGGGSQIVCPGGFGCKLDGSGCASTCAETAECQPDAWCSNGSCIEKSDVGEPCTADEQCLDGDCAGGFCCAGCCDTGTLGTDEFPRAMEICGATDYGFQGKASCARIIADFGNFSHDDHSPLLDDTAMVQLSTGRAAETDNQQNGENQNTSGSDPDGTVNQAFDLCGFTVTLQVPPDAQGFAFDFNFFSAEYPEWVGTQYNDTFNAMLTAQDYDNENVAFDSAGNPISINVAFFTICNGSGCTQPASVLQGTGYNGGVGGATGWLTTTVPVEAGETMTLRLVIYDEGDHIYDSDVLINNFRWLQTVSGTGPVTE